MKVLVRENEDLRREGRWDIDYHLPPELIAEFPVEIHRTVAQCATIVRDTKDPTLEPEATFQYIDISSIDVETGEIVNPQELTGQEAPSRARKLVRAYDIIISTCRPTRGAIAVVPESLHGQICSTGFSVIRARENYNPFCLHFALRLPSTLEQFRKWSTGSSYPAILDEDVAKTIVPVPSDIEEQDRIARRVRLAGRKRAEIIARANKEWEAEVEHVVRSMRQKEAIIAHDDSDEGIVWALAQIRARQAALPAIQVPPRPKRGRRRRLEDMPDFLADLVLDEDEDEAKHDRAAAE